MNNALLFLISFVHICPHALTEDCRKGGFPSYPYLGWRLLYWQRVTMFSEGYFFFQNIVIGQIKQVFSMCFSETQPFKKKSPNPRPIKSVHLSKTLVYPPPQSWARRQWGVHHWAPPPTPPHPQHLTYANPPWGSNPVARRSLVKVAALRTISESKVNLLVRPVHQRMPRQTLSRRSCQEKQKRRRITHQWLQLCLRQPRWD